MNPSIRLKKAILLCLVALTCFAVSPSSRAVTPPPDGGYPNQNTAEGTNALFSLTSGGANTAIGFNALFNNTTGNDNTAIGFEALLNNTTGFQNTANGFGALEHNTIGSDNTANGVLALALNTTGSRNTAVGDFALGDNTSGFGNTATGVMALESNRNGDFNTANGFEALLGNRTGRNNTATGFEALGFNTTGNNNTALGLRSLSSNSTGNFNVAIGPNAGDKLTTGSNNIDIGNRGIADESNTIRIGDQQVQTTTFVAGISGVPVRGDVVVVNANGKLGVVASSQRFKDAVRPMENASKAILALKPVTFRYKKEIDPAGTSQFGLVAEDVEKVNPDLVVRDKDGKPYSVRYDAVNAMLLNEFLKEHQKVEDLENDLRSTIAQQQWQIEALAAGLQKVTAQLEVSKPAPQRALNDQ